MPHDPLRAYIWYSIAARLASDQALRDKAVRGRDRIEQKIALPENVNFAVNARYARALLDRSGVPYQTATTDETLSTPAIAERALKFTVLVQCFR